MMVQNKAEVDDAKMNDVGSDEFYMKTTIHSK